MRTGPELFLEGLSEGGGRPVTLPGKPDHIVFDYKVESGKYAGKVVRHGLIVPPDFPFTAPTGIHIAEMIHPFSGGGAHPTGAIHAQQALPFQEALGGTWQYWSRPFPDWASSKKTFQTYMSHVWRLWNSQ